MTDPRRTLTEEMPENPQDFQQRQLQEVGGQIQAAPNPPRLLTEDLPQEDEDEHLSRLPSSVRRTLES